MSLAVCVCVCVCVCVSAKAASCSHHAEKSVGARRWREEGGGRQSCGEPKSFPFSHPFDVLPLLCNRLMSLRRRRPSEKEESFIKMSLYRTFINLAFPCTFLAHVHIARPALQRQFDSRQRQNHMNYRSAYIPADPL